MFALQGPLLLLVAQLGRRAVVAVAVAAVGAVLVQLTG